MKPTHTTKEGFGGLLKEGLKCEIVSREKENVLIKIWDKTQYYWGKIYDLVEIKNP